MLETALTAAGIALAVSAAVNFLSAWAIRVRLRRLEMSLAEWEERLMTEVKRRAAKASIDARQTRLNPIDEALIRQHTANLGVEVTDELEPWWSKLIGKRSDG